MTIALADPDGTPFGWLLSQNRYYVVAMPLAESDRPILGQALLLGALARTLRDHIICCGANPRSDNAANPEVKLELLIP